MAAQDYIRRTCLSSNPSVKLASEAHNVTVRPPSIRTDRQLTPGLNSKIGTRKKWHFLFLCPGIGLQCFYSSTARY